LFPDTGTTGVESADMVNLIWLDIFVLLSFAAACLASYCLGRPKARKWAWSVLLALASLSFVVVMAHATLRGIWFGLELPSPLAELDRAMSNLYRWLSGTG
jgi:hypothetical protein